VNAYAYTANALWAVSCLPEWRRFQHAAKHVEETQAGLLRRCLHSNQDTEYGQKLQFARITSTSGYQKNVPLTAYDDYGEYIRRIGEGESSVLTAEPVRMFELSSGSTAASKLIPYTDTLKAEFQRGIAPWIYDLYTNISELKQGPAYWSVTPLVDGRRYTPAGIPIGFESDSAYLGLVGKWLADSVMAVPNGVKNISDMDSFRYVTLLCLLRQPDLRLISVWNPTFLSLLLAPLSDWWESLLDDIAHGTISKQDVALRVPPDPKRARALEDIDPADVQAIWPNLQLISCWTEGASASYARQLEELFPRARLQGKGLLATEAFVSLPILGVEGSVLAVNSHFFEFIDDAGDVHLMHEVQKGKTYSVVITTGGGFYRYQLHDLVEVVGHWRQTPCIRFVGKADHISDWFGEKLEERFAARTLQEVFAKHEVSPPFAMLAPDDADGFRYILYLEGERSVENLGEDLDLALRANFHYDYCRKLGQLQAVEVVYVTNGAESYLKACQARGQKLGNIKQSVLQKKTGWRDFFTSRNSEADFN
jgi:hypothetical protein